MKLDDLIIKIKEDIKNANYDFVPTLKNNNSKRKYGITIIDMENSILQLQISDLHKGPIIDRDIPSEYLYIFKKEIQKGIYFYIKLKIVNNQLKILSFHEDE